MAGAHLDNLGPLALEPIIQGAPAPSHSDNALTDRHDDLDAAIQRDEHMPVSDSIFGRSFDERRHPLGKHDPSRDSKTTEREQGALANMAGRLTRIVKRYTAFCLGIFVGAFIAQFPDLVTALLRMTWAFATNPTPLRIAIIAGEIFLLWMVGKWIASRRARTA